MPLSESDGHRIAPYVSNLDNGVFALAGLPEEVIAVLFAYYSRSKDDLRTNLAKLLADEELDVAGPSSASAAFRLASDKARAFHEKWVVGYGHGSVAEHAVVHLALEGVSIVATKAIEDLRLGSYTEKSTRYVPFDEGSFCELPDLPEKLRTTYQEACRGLFRAYLALTPRVEAEVRRRSPRAEGQTERGYEAAVRAKTLDLLRGLLPAGTKTNLGLTANARAMESLLSKMLSSPLEEVRGLATAMHREAATVAPTLVKYVAESPYRKGLRERGQALPQQLGAARAEVNGGGEPRRVKLLHHDKDALARVVMALAYDGCDAAVDASALLDAATHSTGEKRLAILRGALEGRGRFEPAPRAFEATTLAAELTMDFGAYRDLQRHRMLSPFTQRLGCDLGAEVPAELEEMGVAKEFKEALALGEKAHRAMAGSHPWHAQYAVPLAYRVRTVWQMNLREVFHVVELRSAKQGHASYRRVAQDLHKEVVKVMPWLEGLMRVDLEDYALGRA